ncbi:ATP-binding cassette domain-containing protein [candidate division KSB1 bacterium]|nr:ATP-binding cassette domain-containing protein [candidate division KSB1 bacterium]
MQQFLDIQSLSFSYPNNPLPIFESISLRLHNGWTGVVGANGSGKTSFLKLICGILSPISGSVSADSSYYCEQRTDDPPPLLVDLVTAMDKYAFKLKNQLDIQETWLQNWKHLSHGERKRCQIGCALYQQPVVLALDEPTNHLDQSGKELLISVLKSFRGIGVLVSHDRHVLDTLTSQTLFISPPNIISNNCSYSTAAAEMEKQQKAQQHRRDNARKEVKRLHRSVMQKQADVSWANKQNSKKHLNRKDHDARSKRDLGRLTGKDAVHANIQKRLKNKLDTALEKQKSIRVEKSSAQGVSFSGENDSSRFPIILPGATLSLGERRQLRVPERVIEACEKIGLVGENGFGKSTLVRYMIDRIPVGSDDILYIPQEIPLETSTEILQRVLSRNSAEKGKIMALVDRLGSSPDFLLQSALPTPGQLRKLMLAEGLLQEPALIIMDEPTNHMDLPSIECIETALKQCDIAMLLVSHDRIFLQRVVSRFWQIRKTNDETLTLVDVDHF